MKIESAEKINFERKPSPYNHPEFSEIEPSMISLVKKMKDKLAKGAYDYIISDDVSGRIPSLIFKKIIDSLHPEQRAGILHIAAGREYSKIMAIVSREMPPQDSTDLEKIEALKVYKQLKSVLKKKVRPKNKGKALVVTENIQTGSSMEALKKTLVAAGIKFDIAVLGQMKGFEEEQWPVNKLAEPGVEVFKGDIELNLDNSFLEFSHVYAGVEKGEQKLPFPQLYSKVMEPKKIVYTAKQLETMVELKKTMDTNEDPGNKIYNDLVDKFEKENKNINPAELKKEFHQAVIKTRQDIGTMAKRVVAKVWPLKEI